MTYSLSRFDSWFKTDKFVEMEEKNYYIQKYIYLPIILDQTFNKLN